ncbi:MAG: hypothetical protein R3E21_01680 [Caenibius sp.]
MSHFQTISAKGLVRIIIRYSLAVFITLLWIFSSQSARSQEAPNVVISYYGPNADQARAFEDTFKSAIVSLTPKARDGTRFKSHILAANSPEAYSFSLNLIGNNSTATGCRVYMDKEGIYQIKLARVLTIRIISIDSLNKQIINNQKFQINTINIININKRIISNMAEQALSGGMTIDRMAKISEVDRETAEYGRKLAEYRRKRVDLERDIRSEIASARTERTQLHCQTITFNGKPIDVNAL